jgi:GntR family transcriptional regulator, transcriptional repressor for pyruvate dehydrogenase complex
VEIRAGSGIHVVSRDPAPSARVLEPTAFGPFEIMRARQVVEGELAALAAAHATKAQVAGLREALVQMEDDIAQGAMPIQADRMFHLRVAEAAENGPLVRTVATLYDERNNPLFELMGHHFENEKTWRKAIAEHRTVVAAIAAHKPEAARTAMQLHLQRSQERYADAWPPSKEAAEAAADAH